MLARLLHWYFTTDSPEIATIRTFVRRNAALRFTARVLFVLVRGIVQFPRWCLRWTRRLVTNPRSTLKTLRRALSPKFPGNTRAIAKARAIGGALSLAELEDVWSAGSRYERALCITAEPEFRQVEALLQSRNRQGHIAWFDSKLDQEQGASRASDSHYDLIVIGAGYKPDPSLADVSAASVVIRLGNSTPLSAWGYRLDFVAPRQDSPSADGLSGKLRSGEPIDVLLLNDVGFKYGAGIGLRRQTSSFLLNGWNVRVAAWAPGNGTQQPPVTGLESFANWQGVVSLSGLARAKFDEDPVEVINLEIERWNPDIVITGNLHGTEWPLELLARLHNSQRSLVAYMHDAYWATGRCAYPGTCTLFKTGCTSACPTPHEYPRLSPNRIADAWARRQALFAGRGGIPLVANSRWTQTLVKQRFADAAYCGLVPLGLDHHLFSPIPKADARRLLNLPQDKVLIALGAVDLNDNRKGGPLFRALHQALLKRENVGMLLFGAASRELESEKSFGLVDDERLLPLLYSAADIYIGTAVEEAFGQTLLEASACGIPVIAFDVGGISDVVANGETGCLIDELAVEPMLAAIDSLVANSARREKLGRSGRRRVESRFTLGHQARAWNEFIAELSEARIVSR
jgi:glycosyltransferase involved in cell wall biosynthesis